MAFVVLKSGVTKPHHEIQHEVAHSVRKQVRLLVGLFAFA